MMVEARTDHAADDLSRLAEASARLFAEQSKAMAVMTAFGVSVAAGMTSIFLGALRGPGFTDDTEEVVPAMNKAPVAAELSTATVVPLRPRPSKASGTGTAKTVVGPASKAARTTKAPATKSTRTAAKAAAPLDDLKKISGIGPRLEQELNLRGIVGYADIVTLSKAAVKKLDSELGLDGRITKDDWAGQARALSGGKG
jgi:NADH-quinone oxidoreductase subunit E